MQLTDISSDKPVRSVREPIQSGQDLDGWRRELDDYYNEMARFCDYEPDEIFAMLSGFTSRFSFIRTQIMRSSSRILQAFRTGEIDPFITECDRQFKFWSRVQSVNQMDWNAQRNVT